MTFSKFTPHFLKQKLEIFDIKTPTTGSNFNTYVDRRLVIACVFHVTLKAEIALRTCVRVMLCQSAKYENCVLSASWFSEWGNRWVSDASDILEHHVRTSRSNVSTYGATFPWWLICTENKIQVCEIRDIPILNRWTEITRSSSQLIDVVSKSSTVVWVNIEFWTWRWQCINPILGVRRNELCIESRRNVGPLLHQKS